MQTAFFLYNRLIFSLKKKVLTYVDKITSLEDVLISIL